MTLLQALAYFAREASANLLRGWKVSLLAILTITGSLYLAGVFLLVGGNLRRIVENWQGESKIVLYLAETDDRQALEQLRQEVQEAPWTLEVDSISTETARQRFEESFPSMLDLLEGWSEDPLPASLEVAVDWNQLEGREDLDRWLQDLRSNPVVIMVDDDRDWLGQLGAVVLVIEGLGLVLGGILLLTAVFTISSVIRLTAFLYRDEIAVMRLVGATEFFIRGPFYFEGMLQGLCGGALAVLGLTGSYHLLVEQGSDALLTFFLTAEFLRPLQLLALVVFGGAAGLLGAITSLRKESLGSPDEGPEWLATDS